MFSCCTGWAAVSSGVQHVQQRASVLQHTELCSSAVQQGLVGGSCNGVSAVPDNSSRLLLQWFRKLVPVLICLRPGFDPGPLRGGFRSAEAFPP